MYTHPEPTTLFLSHPVLGLSLSLNSNGEVIRVNQYPGQETTDHPFIKALQAYLLTNSLELYKIPVNFGSASIEQQAVWAELLKVTPGTTVSYSELGTRVNLHPRVVGRYLNQNPVPILRPCHRVIQKSGKLAGFVWGLPVKEWLLKHERQ